MARSNPLDLLRTAAREGVHAGVTVGGKALGHAATLARSGLVRGQAVVTAATARRQQPPARPARDEPDTDLHEPPVDAVETVDEEPAETPPAPTSRRTSSPSSSSAPSPAEVAKRAHPRPAGRPPAKKAARKAPSGPGAKLPPRRETEQD